MSIGSGCDRHKNVEPLLSGSHRGSLGQGRPRARVLLSVGDLTVIGGMEKRSKSIGTVIAGFFDRSEEDEISNDLHIVRRMSTFFSNQLRIAVMGSKGVGKTSVVNSLNNCLQEYKKDSTRPYNPAQAQKRAFLLDVMDTESVMPPNFKRLFMRNANVFVLVYDVSNMKSFEHIVQLRAELVELKGDDVPIVVLGTKLDKGERNVHPVMADCIVSIDWEVMHHEVSSNDTLKLYDIFDEFLSHPAVINMQSQHQINTEVLLRERAITLSRRRKSSIVSWLRTKRAKLQ